MSTTKPINDHTVASALTRRMVQGKFGSDSLGGGGPDEGFGVFVRGGNVSSGRLFESATERNTPRFRLCRVSLEKKPSTALSQEHEVGVK